MNESPPQSSSPDQIFRSWFLVALAVANSAAAFVAARDSGFVTLGMIVAWGPSMNGLFALVGIAAAFPLRRRMKGMAVGHHVGIVVGSAALGILAVPLMSAAFSEVLSIIRR